MFAPSPSSLSIVLIVPVCGVCAIAGVAVSVMVTSAVARRASPASWKGGGSWNVSSDCAWPSVAFRLQIMRTDGRIIFRRKCQRKLGREAPPHRAGNPGAKGGPVPASSPAGTAAPPSPGPPASAPSCRPRPAAAPRPRRAAWPAARDRRAAPSPSRRSAPDSPRTPAAAGAARHRLPESGLDHPMEQRLPLPKSISASIRGDIYYSRYLKS